MSIQVNFNQFYVFYICVKLGSFTKAAQELNVTLPAISMQINKLEKNLEFQLFTKKSGKIELSKKGLEILPVVNEMYSNAERLNEKIQSLTRSVYSKIMLGMHLVPAQYFTPLIARYLESKSPSTKVDFIIDNHEEILEKLRKKEIDIALIAGDHQLDDIYQQDFVRSEIIYAVCPDNPLGKKEVMMLEELSKTPTILSGEGSGFSKHLAKFYKKYKLFFDNENTELGSTVAKSFLPKSQYGAFFTDFFIEKELREKSLIQINLEISPDPMPFYFACLESRKNNQSIKEFFEIFKSENEFIRFKNNC